MIETANEESTREKKVNQPQNKQAPQQQIDPLTVDIIEEFTKINGERCSKVYKKLSFLGKGGFAECYLTQQKETNRKAATKIIPKKLLDSHRTRLRLFNQIKLHKSLRHDNIVQFYNTFEDEQNVYISLQVCENGCINDILRARYSFKTPEVQSFLFGICNGVKYLHSRNIIHRDLKLGNIFLSSDMKVKIGDFGLACRLQFAKEFKRTVCGTPNYIAPQILQGKGYHFEVDIWAIGVIIFTLFFTIPPFETEEPHSTYQKIKKCQYQIPKYNDVPPEAVQLIKKLLVPNPAQRLTLDEILQSPFMKLGGSIPLGLPPVCLNRPPNKKELMNWPKIITKEEEQQQKQLTVLGFLGLTKKNIQAEKQTKIKNRHQNQHDSNNLSFFCRSIEQSSNDIITFYLNNGIFGIYDISKSEFYTSQLRQKNQKAADLVKKTSFDENGVIKEEDIPWSDCIQKVRLNIKHKELMQTKAQLSICDTSPKPIMIERINVYKDVLMVRLTNRAIQVVYKQNDGFLLSPNRKTLVYFYSFNDLDQGKQVSLTQALGNDKQNRLNSSTQFSLNTIFKSKKNQKNFLTMKKIAYLKGILLETHNRNSQKAA